ncbi:uncharacterized protein LOC129585540 [Paramacrobiotus metropolitanus]|uniref:uncharacterized protein LOC129585540 n=1 Tax=Paramacrobiotus metropolitanus TaxID=2943436 RepID=UPI002445DB03|nr:uncharacterized protein LOC129585540 [Paramacrobiotus metropolitanus]
MKPPSTPSISYRELIRAIGIDPETSPSSWRKAIDHSAETPSGEDKQGRLIPTVFVDETQLSSDYVKAVIGRRFLSDEDDLMKLLEHMGVLRPDEDASDEQENEWHDETESASYLPQPEPKRARFTRPTRSHSYTGTVDDPIQFTTTSCHTSSDLTSHLPGTTDNLSTSVPEGNTAEAIDADMEMRDSVAEDDDDEEHLESGLQNERDFEDFNDEGSKSDTVQNYLLLTPVEEVAGEADVFSDEETTVLIDTVHAHPVLWRRQGHFTRTALTERSRQKQLAWEKVADAVSRATAAGWPKKSSQQCFKKWDGLRGYFRMLLRTKNEDELSCVAWPFIKQMTFMTSVYRIRKKRDDCVGNS